MELSERKKRILRAIIESYIQSAEPVGSKAILDVIGLDVSSATVRNDMADLEAMGLQAAFPLPKVTASMSMS